eukprot:14452086-Alexandrium_andersonii.AAC.1
MHELHLGAGQHMVANVLYQLGGTDKTALKRLYIEFKTWAKTHRQRHSHTSPFTKAQIGKARAASFPEMKVKAHNCRVLTAWLADKLKTIAEGPTASDTDRLMA